MDEHIKRYYLYMLGLTAIQQDDTGYLQYLKKYNNLKAIRNER